MKCVYCNKSGGQLIEITYSSRKILKGEELPQSIILHELCLESFKSARPVFWRAMEINPTLSIWKI